MALVAMLLTSGKVGQVIYVPQLRCQPSMRTCLSCRSNVFRARLNDFQHVVACTSPSVAVRQQAGSLHLLIPRQSEIIWGWLPASLLLMLRLFPALMGSVSALPVFAQVDTGSSHQHMPHVLACS